MENISTSIKLKDLNKEKLIAEAERIEKEVHFFELDSAKRAGVDLGQAMVLRRLATEQENDKKE